MNTSRFTSRFWRPLGIVAGLLLAAAPQVRADYQSTVLGDTPLAYYPLNLDVDTSGTATDVSGNGNGGTYINIYSGYNNAAGPSAYITNAISFDGYDNSVDLSSAPNLSFTGPAALEAWVQPADSTSFGNIIAKGYDSSTYQEIALRVNGPYGANYFGNFGNGSVSGGQQTTDWVHVVLSNDGTNTSLYIDGALIQSTSDTNGAIAFSDPWAIGNGTSAGNTRYFKGNISEVAIYKHSLTAGQILKHFYAGLLNSDPAVSVPIIVTQPQSQASYVGGSVAFSVGAVSALPMTNQWLKGSSPLSGQTNATLHLSNLQLGDAGSYSVVVGNPNGTTNSAAATLTVSTPHSLQWSALGNDGTWDTGITANWINLSNSQQTVFNPGDQVLFDDTVGVPTTVTVSNTVVPSLITVNSDNNNYSIQGPGTISGSGSLVKQGASTLTIVAPGNFTGPVAIRGGALYAGNNCLKSVASITITNDATLDLGGGTFSDNKPVLVSGSGLSGEGAIYNSYNDYPSEAMNITMAGDTKFGGSARWDLGAGSRLSGAHNLTIDWSGGANYGEWNTVTVAANVSSISLTAGNFGMKNMDAGFEDPATVFTVGATSEVSFWSGGYNGSFHVLGGGRVDLWTAPAAFNGSRVTLEDGAMWYSWGGNPGDEPINSAMTLNGVAHFLIGDHNLIYTNLISGPGGFVADAWNHQLVFSAANTYTGPTILGNGPQIALVGNGSISQSTLIFFGAGSGSSVCLDASARTDGTFTLANGQVLQGIGGVTGNLVEATAATIAPAGTNITIGITNGGSSTGAITASGNITLSGTNVLKLNGSGVNDSIQAGGTLAYGGTLNLVNLSGAPLAAGDSFQLFTAGAGISGSFTQIIPSTPGAGLLWDTTQLGSGILSVVAPTGPEITGVMVSGGNLIFGGNGGTPGGTYYVVTSTNLLTPLASWPVLSTNSYDGAGNFTVTNAVDPGTPQRFYRTKQ